MRRISTAAFAALALTAAGPAAAQGDPTIHRHLGFYLNMDLGFGAMGTKASPGGTEVKMSGTAGDLSIGIGGAVVENLILAGRLWGHTVSSPKVTVNGQSVTATDTTLGLSGIGLDVLYYVMPLNLYLVATPSIATLTAKQGGQSSSTKNGPGMRLAVGKEWWVSDHWGIGLDGNLAFASNKSDDFGNPTWKTVAFGIAFSATYN